MTFRGPDEVVPARWRYQERVASVSIHDPVVAPESKSMRPGGSCERREDHRLQQGGSLPRALSRRRMRRMIAAGELRSAFNARVGGRGRPYASRSVSRRRRKATCSTFSSAWASADRGSSTDSTHTRCASSRASECSTRYGVDISAISGGCSAGRSQPLSELESRIYVIRRPIGFHLKGIRERGATCKGG